MFHAFDKIHSITLILVYTLIEDPFLKTKTFSTRCDLQLDFYFIVLNSVN
jgi:hypothetical protein